MQQKPWERRVRFIGKYWRLFIVLFIAILIGGTYLFFTVDINIPTQSPQSAQNTQSQSEDTITGELSPQQKRNAETLFDRSDGQVELVASQGVIRSVNQVSSCSNCHSNEERVLNYFNSYRDLYQIDDFSRDFVFYDSKSSQYGTALKYRQEFNSIPVSGSSMIVSFNTENQILLVSGNYITRNYYPQGQSQHLSVDEVFSAVEKLSYVADRNSSPVLVYYNPQIIGKEPSQTHLAWEVLAFEDGIPVKILLSDVDATEISKSYLLYTSGIFQIADYQNKKISDGANFCKQATSLTPVFNSTDKYLGEDPELIQLSQVIENTLSAYERLLKWEGNSTPDKKLFVIRNVDYSSPFSCPGSPVVGFTGASTENSDVFAHEYQHQVTRQLTILEYNKENPEQGAVMEAYSDIFTLLTTPDKDKWQIMLGGQVLRDMKNPSSANKQHPDHYSRINKVNFFSLFPTEEAKKGYPHFNSTIISHAAYLLAEGGTAHGIRVEGIGVEPMLIIFFEALQKLPSAANIYSTRVQNICACESIHGPDAQICDQVKNAFAAVGVGNPATKRTAPVNKPNFDNNLINRIKQSILDARESLMQKLNQQLDKANLSIDNLAIRIRTEAQRVFLELMMRLAEAMARWIEELVEQMMWQTCGGSLALPLLPVALFLLVKRLMR